MIELTLVGVRVEIPSNHPIALLQETHGSRLLPIWIGAVEATAIAVALQGIEQPRPMTHDLLAEVFRSFDATVHRIVITELREQTFYAVIDAEIAGRREEISSRPSDAIALAVRLQCPIFASEEVLEEASIPAPEDEEEELEKFRTFLDSVNPEDFA